MKTQPYGKEERKRREEFKYGIMHQSQEEQIPAYS